MSLPPQVPITETDPVTRPPRDMALPPQPGEDVGMYNVVSCTPERLTLKVSATFILFVLAACGIAVLWALFNLSFASSPSTTSYDYRWQGKYHGVILCAAIIGIVAVFNLGRRMVIDRQRIRVTWAYFWTKEHSADQFKSVNLEIVKPSIHVTPPTKESVAIVPPSAPVANTAVLRLAGLGPDAREWRLKIGEAAMSTRNWPSLAAAAVHVSRMLQIPLVIEGSPELATPPNQLLLTQMQSRAYGR